MSFLDNTGLSYYDGKISAKFASINQAIGNNMTMIKGSYQNNVWSSSNTGWTVFLKVRPGAEYMFEAPSGYNSPYIGMRSLSSVPPVDNTPADFSEATGWTVSRTVATGATETGTIPNDVEWIEFYSGTNSDPTRRLPVKLIVDGYDYRVSIVNNIVELMVKVKEDEANIDGLLPDMDETKTLLENNLFGLYRSVSGYYNNGVWSSGNQTVFIKVRPASRILLTAPSGYSSPYAGLTDVSFPLKNGDQEHYSSAEDWTSDRSVSSGTTEAIIIPDDVNWLLLYSGTTSYPTRRLPVRIIINGIDYTESMTYIADFTTDIKNLSEIGRCHEKKKNIRTAGHGGYTAIYPHDSLMSYRDAYRHGFKWVETDVQFTADNVPVLCHDDGLYTYARNPDGTRIGTSLDDTVYISETTYNDLLYYDFGLAKSPSLAGMKITTFEQLMATARHLDLCVSIEIKKVKLPTLEQLQILFDLADKYHMRNDIEFVSADQYVLADIHRIDPFVTIGFIGSISDWSVRYMLSLRGQNEVRIELSSSPTATAIGRAKAAHIPIGFGPCTTSSDFLTADPYITYFTSNGLLADDVFKEYEIGQM